MKKTALSQMSRIQLGVTAMLVGLSVSCVPPAATTSSVPTSQASTDFGVVSDAKGFRVDVCQTVSESGSSTSGGTGTCKQGKFFIHKKGDRTQDCVVNSSSSWVSGADLECEAEAQELDLAFSGINFNYNVPTNMCAYVTFSPYTFWNFEPGNAPRSVSYSVTRDGEKPIAGSISVNPPGSARVDPETGDFTCKYDRSADDVPGPNCCMGTTTVTKIAVDPGNSRAESFSVDVVAPAETFTVSNVSVPNVQVTNAVAKYFTFSSATTNYYVWFQDNNTPANGTDPAVTGTTGVQVKYLTADTGAQLAQKIATALNGVEGGVSATASGSSVTVSISAGSNVTNAAVGTATALSVAVNNGGPAGLDSKYFTFSTAVAASSATSISTDSTMVPYVVFLAVSPSTIEPVVSGTKIRVSYAASDTSAELASKIAAQVAQSVGSEAQVTADASKVTVTLGRAAVVPVASQATSGNSGFLVTRLAIGKLATTTMTESVKATGQYSSCLSGPAMATQKKSREGWPTDDIFATEGVGLNRLYKVASSGAMPQRSTVFQANFYSGATWPMGLVGMGNNYPNPDYVVTCLDRSEEVLARIRIKVREWNSSALFVNYRDRLAGSTAAPAVNDDQATAASDCGIYAPGGGIPLVDYGFTAACFDKPGYTMNDHADWNDIHPSNFMVGPVTASAELAGKYFVFSSTEDADLGPTLNSYYVWFKTSSSGVDPAPGLIPIVVTYATTDTGFELANKIRDAVNNARGANNAVLPFSAKVDSVSGVSRVTISMHRQSQAVSWLFDPSASPRDINTGFDVTVQNGYPERIFSTSSGEAGGN